MFGRFESGERGGCFGGRHERQEHFARFGARRGPFGPGPGFGGGRERMFDGGGLQLVILQLLSEKPSYGYELIKAIEERFGGGYAPSPGVVYPTLTLLEERGFAEIVNSEGNRKVYGVTEAGRAELLAQADVLKELEERIQHKGEAFGRERSPLIMHAFRGLGEAIRHRMGTVRLNEEQIAKIAKAIDDAAAAIRGA